MANQICISSVSKHDDEGTGVSFKVSQEANVILTNSAKNAIRAKKAEAKLRLEDHCKRFPDWKPS